jgi:hypothetical protein
MHRRIVRNPFLTLALAGLGLAISWHLLLAAIPEHPLLDVHFAVWVLILRPFSFVATVIDPYLRWAPEWVDVVVTLGAGLLPYLTADLLVRRLVRLRSQSIMPAGR